MGTKIDYVRIWYGSFLSVVTAECRTIGHA